MTTRAGSGAGVRTTRSIRAPGEFGSVPRRGLGAQSDPAPKDTSPTPVSTSSPVMRYREGRRRSRDNRTVDESVPLESALAAQPQCLGAALGGVRAMHRFLRAPARSLGPVGRRLAPGRQLVLEL